MKKLFAFLLTFCLVFSVLPAAAAEEVTEVASGTWGDNIAWKLTGDGTLIVSGEGDAAEATSDNRYPWYAYAEQIRKVIFEEGVTNVPVSAFEYAYPNLTSAELKSVEVIGSTAFAQCYALTSVILPDTLTEIDNGAFSSTGITTIEIHEGVIAIGSGAFSYTPLTEIVMPEGLESLGSDAFLFCSSLKTVVLPDSLSSWDMLVFGNCTALESINIPAGVTNIRESAFTDCKSLKSIEIPGSITMILPSAFSNCGLEEITFQGDAPMIYDYSFENVTATVYYPAGNETWTEDKFQNYGGTLTWMAYGESLPCEDGHHVPAVNAGGQETGVCEYCGIPCKTSGTTIKAIEEDGTMIVYGTGENGAGESVNGWTEYADQVTSLIVEEGVTGAVFNFEGFENLKTVSLSNGITEISKFAFQGCINLEQINIPANLSYLGSGAFRDCKNLTEVFLPATTAGIGSGVFAGCTNLAGIWVDENNPDYVSDEQGVLYNKAKSMLYQAPGKLAGHYTIPGTAVDLYPAAFEGCAELTSVTISEGVEWIYTNVFKDCTSLEAVTIPGSVLELSDSVFANCTALETVTFTGDAPAIYGDCFLGVTATVYYPAGNETWTEDKFQNYGGTLTWVAYEVPAEVVAEGTCGEGLTWVLTDDGTLTVSGVGEVKSKGWQDYADQIITVVVENGITGEITGFDQLENLTSVYLSKDITAIGRGAFAVCPKLEKINFPEALTDIGSYAFQGCVSLKEVQLPATLSCNMGGRPFGGCTSLAGIWVDEANPWFANDEYGVLFSKDMTRLVEAPGALSGHYTIPDTVTDIEWAAFDGCRQLTGVEIPDGITWLQMNLFENCTALKAVTVPASVSSIWVNAFMGCTALETVTFEGNAPDIMGDIFQNVTATVYYPAGNKTWTEEVMQSYGGTINWVAYGEVAPEEIASGWSGVNQWTLTADGVMTVYGSGKTKNYGYGGGQPWLEYADQITSVVIEEGVTEIGTGTFMNLPKLENVTLPETGLKTIGEAAFYGCSSLKEIYIPDSIYTIWAYTFKGCTALESVRLPKLLVKIDQGAFENCTALDYIYIPGNVDVIGAWSFKGCTALAEADMQWADATQIRAGAFKNCAALTTIRLPAGIQILGDSAFYGIGATSFTVPETVTEVQAWCFARAKLTSITFEGDAPAVGEGAFNKIALTAYYPADNATWTSEIMQDYYGTVTWTAK